MDIEKFQELTGQTISSANERRYHAVIEKTQRILESMLGYTLDGDLVADNFYVETGKTATACPCSTINTGTLLDPDEVTVGYRLFPYNKHDKYLSIDPALSVYAVKLVRNGITLRTITTDEYALHREGSIIRYLEQVQCCFCTCTGDCRHVQLAVDANWLWDNSDNLFPNDLLQVWAEMIEYYADGQKDIKSQTLGTHSYTKFDNTRPQEKKHVLSVLKKYAGPNGDLRVNLTL